MLSIENYEDFNLCEITNKFDEIKGRKIKLNTFCTQHILSTTCSLSQSSCLFQFIFSRIVSDETIPFSKSLLTNSFIVHNDSKRIE